MKSISTAHRRQIESARENMLRSAAAATIQNEILAAKQIQKQTGCTWTDALRAVYKRRS